MITGPAAAPSLRDGYVRALIENWSKNVSSLKRPPAPVSYLDLAFWLPIAATMQ